MKTMNKNQFKVWAKNQNDDFIEKITHYEASVYTEEIIGEYFESVNQAKKIFPLTIEDKYILIFNSKKKEISLIRVKDRKSTTAKCHKDDEFNVLIGIAICWARMKGEEIPRLAKYKKLSEMKYGERFVWLLTEYTFIGQVPNKQIWLSFEKLVDRPAVFKSDISYEMI